jgi:hypothetical protein
MSCLYGPPNIITVIKSERMRGGGHVEHEGEGKIFIIIIYLNCKWVSTRWHWYYNRTIHK